MFTLPRLCTPHRIVFTSLFCLLLQNTFVPALAAQTPEQTHDHGQQKRIQTWMGAYVFASCLSTQGNTPDLQAQGQGWISYIKKNNKEFDDPDVYRELDESIKKKSSSSRTG